MLFYVVTDIESDEFKPQPKERKTGSELFVEFYVFYIKSGKH